MADKAKSVNGQDSGSNGSIGTEPNREDHDAAVPQFKDVFDLLKSDRRQIDKLFDRLKDSSDADRPQLIGELCENLTMHLLLKERLLIPACRAVFADSAQLEQAQINTDLIKILLLELKMPDLQPESRDATLQVLHDLVRRQMRDEEEKQGLLARAKEAHVNTPQLLQQMRDAKGELAKRQHHLPPLYPATLDLLMIARHFREDLMNRRQGDYDRGGYRDDESQASRGYGQPQGGGRYRGEDDYGSGMDNGGRHRPEHQRRQGERVGGYSSQGSYSQSGQYAGPQSGWGDDEFGNGHRSQREFGQYGPGQYRQSQSGQEMYGRPQDHYGDPGGFGDGYGQRDRRRQPYQSDYDGPNYGQQSHFGAGREHEGGQSSRYGRGGQSQYESDYSGGRERQRDYGDYWRYDSERARPGLYDREDQGMRERRHDFDAVREPHREERREVGATGRGWHGESQRDWQERQRHPQGNTGGYFGDEDSRGMRPQSRQDWQDQYGQQGQSGRPGWRQHR